MAEELENKETQGDPGETQETQQTQGTQQTQQTQATQGTPAEAALAEKDARIAELQAEGEALRAERSNLMEQLAELTQLKDAHSQAVSKYLDAVKAANPAIPGDVITGSTIEDIDASLAKAQAIAGAVRTSLENESRNAKVPAGAPPRGSIDIEGLSPLEKISVGVQQGKEGTQ